MSCWSGPFHVPILHQTRHLNQMGAHIPEVKQRNVATLGAMVGTLGLPAMTGVVVQYA